jgi:hypothetical protein
MKTCHEVQHRILGVGCIHHSGRDSILYGWHKILVIDSGWDMSKTAPLLAGLRAEAEPGEEFRFITHTETAEVFSEPA